MESHSKPGTITMKINRILTFAFTVLFSIFLTITAHGFERRKEQFQSESSWLILPMPYSYPGIGSGIMWIGYLGNMVGTKADLVAMGITGDATGSYVSLGDVHLIPETLFFDIDQQKLSHFQVKNYENRGMSSKKEEFKLLEADQLDGQRAKGTLSLFDRRLEFSMEVSDQTMGIKKIRDNEGNLEEEFDKSYVTKTKSTTRSATLDFTDDLQDPLKGIRLKYSEQYTPKTDDNDPDYSVITQSATVYIPIGKQSVWAFHAERSDTKVKEKGNTDKTSIISELGLDCSYESCSEAQKVMVDRIAAEREYGTAKALGGTELFRAYPMDRFKGAHMAYYSTEIRWNFASEVTPFNFWIWKDMATGLQLALFHEYGSVADVEEDLWKESRSSSGVGLRMVSASGVVYRLDLASGNEGSESVLFFDYPW